MFNGSNGPSIIFHPEIQQFALLRVTKTIPHTVAIPDASCYHLFSLTIGAMKANLVQGMNEMKCGRCWTVRRGGDTV